MRSPSCDKVGTTEYLVLARAITEDSPWRLECRLNDFDEAVAWAESAVAIGSRRHGRHKVEAELRRGTWVADESLIDDDGVVWEDARLVFDEGFSLSFYDGRWWEV